MKKHIQYTSPKAFTLVETVIAMGIIAIMITAFLGAFGPAVRGVQKSISIRDINRLASTLENEFSYLGTADDQVEYESAFEKAFLWIEESGQESLDEAVLIYQYRGISLDDGSVEPIQDIGDQTPGEDYVLQSVVRRVGDDGVEDELQPGIVEGRVFYVKMTQLVFTDDGGMELGDAGEIIDPTPDDAGARDPVSSYLDYPEAVIAYKAEFYVLKSNIYSYVSNSFSLDDGNGDGYPDATGKPVFSRNMAVRR